MEVPPEHDPEHARERLREDLAAVFWDAREGHLDVGDELTVQEPTILAPEPAGRADNYFEWTFVYDGDDTFVAISPDGVERGTVEAIDPEGEAWSDDDPLKAMSDVGVAFHRDRQLAKADDRLEEPGDMLILPMHRHAFLLPDGNYAIVTPGYDERSPDESDLPHEEIDVVDELTVDALEAAFEAWQDRFDPPEWADDG